MVLTIIKALLRITGSCAKCIWVLLIMFSLEACRVNHSRDVETINDVLEGQRRAWNNGDLEGYMRGYWMSDSLVFSGGKSISQGWQDALNRYKQSYPDKEAMGNLEFSEFDLRFLSLGSAYSTGKWTLYRSEDTLSGRFTLIWKKVNGAWVIVADHSS
ncbi:MAG: DUF4440 domain-containing protein [Flavobacteriales bacterium]